jgi:hypothetical protein
MAGPTDPIRLHLLVLRTQVEAQLRRIVDARRHWERSALTQNAARMDRIVACLDAMLDVNAAARETCADARVEAINLTDVPATESLSGSAIPGKFPRL